MDPPQWRVTEGRSTRCPCPTRSLGGCTADYPRERASEWPFLGVAAAECAAVCCGSRRKGRFRAPPPTLLTGLESPSVHLQSDHTTKKITQKSGGQKVASTLSRNRRWASIHFNSFRPPSFPPVFCIRNSGSTAFRRQPSRLLALPSTNEKPARKMGVNSDPDARSPAFRAAKDITFGSVSRFLYSSPCFSPRSDEVVPTEKLSFL